MDNIVDVKVRAGVTGREDVRELRGEIGALGDTLEGDVQQQAKDAAQALDALGAQDAAIAKLRSLKNESDALAIDMAQAERAAEQLAQALPASTAEVSRLAVAESQAREAMQGAQRDLDEQRQALAALRLQYTGATRNTDAYREANAQLQVSVREGRAYLSEKTQALREVTAESAAAQRAENALAGQYTAAGQALVTVRGQVDAQAASLREASDQARKMGVDTQNLAEAERALAAATERAISEGRAFVGIQRLNQQAADAQAAAQRRALEAANQATAAAKASAQAVRTAYGELGVRSAQELREEIQRVRNAMEVIGSTAGVSGREVQRAFAAGNAQIRELERELRAATGQLTLADRAAGLFKTTMSQFAAGSLLADGIASLAGRVRDLGREFITSNVQMEGMRRGLTAVYGSSKIAEAQIEVLRAAANRAGVSMSSIADSFVRFSAATRSANIPLSVTNELFAAVTRAGATLGLSGERVTLVLDALGQMASKGVVSMEELRQQLGDSLPGALSLAAKGLGITDTQLIKLVESGKLATEDFFPALTKGLQQMQGSTETLTGNWGRLLNVLNQTATAIGDAGGVAIMTAALKALLVVVGVIVVPLQGFIEFVNLAGRAVYGFYESLKGNGQQAQEDFRKEVDKSAARIVALQKTLDDSINGTEKQGAALGRSAQAHASTASAVLANAAAQERAQAATAGATSTYIQQIVRLAENAAAAEAATTAAEKLLKARQDEGKANVLTAQLTGDATKALEAQATAATTTAAAAAELMIARERELAGVQAGIAALNSQRDASGKLSAAKQEEFDKLTNLLQVKTSEVEASRTSALELSRQALAAQAAAEAYADNSTKVDSFRQAMENSKVVVEILNVRLETMKAELGELNDKLETGKITQEHYDQAARKVTATQEALNKAKGDAAKAENLYRDAVQDQIKALDLKARAQSADLNISLAQANANQRHLEMMARVAREQGNVTLAIELEIDAKTKQIEATRLSARIKQLELDAEEAKLKVERDSLDTGDKLYEQKRQELEIRLQVVKAKRIEAGASEDVIKGIQGEIDAIRRRSQLGNGGGGSPGGGGGGGSGTGGGGGGGGGGGSGGVGGRNPDGSYRRNEDSLGVIPPNQNVHSNLGDTRDQRLSGQNAVDNRLMFELKDKLEAGTLTADDVGSLRAVVAALRQNGKVNADVMRRNPGAISLEGQADDRAWQRRMVQFQEVIDRFTGGGAAAQGGRTVVLDLRTDGRSGGTARVDEAGAKAIEQFTRALASGRRDSGKF